MRKFMMAASAACVFTSALSYGIFPSAWGLIAFYVSVWSLFEWWCYDEN